LATGRHPQTYPMVEGVERAPPWADDWIAALRARLPPLTIREHRQGVRAISSHYVESRGKHGIARRATSGEAKRAAFATYYGPLHLLTVFLTVVRATSVSLDGIERIVDAGCGTGAAGAGLALALRMRRQGEIVPYPTEPPLLGLELLPWPLGIAHQTARHFGLEARYRRCRLPRELPRLRPSDAVILGWSANELQDDERRQLLDRLVDAAAAGARLFVFEPLARAIAPWMDSWDAALGATTHRLHLVKIEAGRPEWIKSLDEASKLDHRVLGARAILPCRDGEE